VSYRKIDTRVWDDERVAPLPALTKLTWFCILTGPHTTGLPGLYSCGIATLSESMREGIDTVSKAVAELVATGMVRFNPTVRVVQVPNAPKYNPCPNEKVLKGWLSLWKGIADCPEKFAHIERLRDAVDPASTWGEKAWGATFGKVSVPDRYRIQTVPNSTATTTATATAKELSPAAVAPSALPAQATVAPLALDLDDPKPTPTKATKPRTTKPAADPPPFSIGDAFEALASSAGGRFAAGVEGDWTRGVRIAVAKSVRQYPDLGAWRLVGEWLAAGGDRFRGVLGPSWAASGALADTVARAREWDATGRPALAGGPATFGQTPSQARTSPDIWTLAAAKQGVVL